jgi:carboxypeptidase D
VDTQQLSSKCSVILPLFAAARAVNPCFNIYHIGQSCPIPFDPLGFPYTGHYLPPTFPRPYFDLTTVKSALHVPWDYNWTITTSFPVFINGVDISPASTYSPALDTPSPLQAVIEHTSNVIIANGDLDMAVPTNGTLLVLPKLT